MGKGDREVVPIEPSSTAGLLVARRAGSRLASALMAKPDEIETLIREFAARIRAAAEREASARVSAHLEAAQANFAKAGAIFAQLSGKAVGKVAKGVAAPKPGKRVRRSPEQLEQQKRALLAAIKKTPGSRIDKLASATGLSVAELGVPVAQLKAEKLISTKGLKRTTAYYPKA